MRLRRGLLVLAACLVNSSAPAQSVYAVGSIAIDIQKAGGAVTDGIRFPAGSGESVSGAARLGVVQTQRWGIELEIARAGQSESNTTFDAHLPFFDGVDPFDVRVNIDRRDRISTISTVGAFHQSIGGAITVAYVGGIVFHRTETWMRTKQRELVPLAPDGFFDDTTSDSLSVWYGAGPVAGLEAHVRIGAHGRFVPGIRMHGIESSWLIRPSMGLGWTF